MYSLLKTEKLDLIEAKPSEENTTNNHLVDLCAFASDGEQSILATYINHSLVLRTIVAKHRQNVSTKTIDWTGLGYGRLLALAFDVLGTKLVAVDSKYLHILPNLTYMRQSSSSKEGHVEKVRLPSSMSNKVTCCIWWQTALHRDVVIIGTEKGEVIFMDVSDKRYILKRQVNGQITRLELVPDDRQHKTYLLISGRSSLQWKLLLDVLDHNLQLTLSPYHMAAQGYLFYGGKTYMKSILNTKNLQSSEKEFEAQRFTTLPISVTLKYQNAKGCHLLSAVDKVDNSLKIYDSSLEHNPLFIYSLPLWSEHVVYTDRLIFIALSAQHVQVLANQLSEKDSSTAKGPHTLYRDSLEENESVLYMNSIRFPTAWYTELRKSSEDSQCQADHHTILDGCVLVTNKRLIQFFPNISPEQLFLNWSVAPLLDVDRLEMLAKVTNIDILNLYLKTAKYHLTNGNAEIALDYLACSKCDELLKISMLYKHKQYELVIELGAEILHTTNSKISASIRADISNMVLTSYIYLTVASTSRELSSNSQFREFLLYNTLYSLDTAMTLLCQHDAISLLLHLSLNRKFVCAALEHIFNQGKITADILHEYITCKEFVSALGTVLDGAIVRLLAPADLCTYLLIKEDIKQSDLLWLTLRLSDVDKDNLQLMAQRYHPRSNFVQINIAKYKEYVETAAMQSYATVEQEVEDPSTHKPDDYISSLYMFYTKLLLALAPSIPHRCLLKKNLVKLCSNTSNSLDKKLDRTVELQCNKYGRPLCCCSYTAYSIQRNTLFTWGSKDKLDSLSIEDRVKVSTPSIVELSMVNAADIKTISCGEKHLMMLCTDGLYGTGSSIYGQVGTGACQQYEQAVKVSITDCVDVVCGRYHTLAIDKHGRLYSWGWGVFGQLGHDSIDSELSPRRVESLEDVFITSIAAGHSHSLALSIQGDLWVFGNNTFGQIDVKRNVSKVSSPLHLDLGSPVRRISTKYFHNVAVLHSGVVLRWGIHPFCLRKKIQSVASSEDKSLLSDNRTSLVDNMKDFSQVDTAACSGEIIQVECGSSHTAILTDIGNVYISVETQQHAVYHMMNIAVKDVVYIAANSGYTLALCADGSLHSWGRNNFGQLGLALRSVRYVESPGEVRIAASYGRASTADMYGTRVIERMICAGSTSDPHSHNKHFNIADYDPLEMYKLSRAEAFPHQQLLNMFISSSYYPAAIAILCSTSSWSEAFFYHLKFLLLCQGHLKDTYCDTVLDVMLFYLEKINPQEHAIHGINSHITQILYRMLQFWQAKHLPVRPEFEGRLLLNLDLVGPFLYQLLLGQSAQSKVADTLNKQLSSGFLASLTRSYMAWISQQSGLDDKSAAWNGLVKTLHNASVTRATCNISHFDIDKLKGDTDNRVVVFTCGHHFTINSLHSKALPTFESRVLNKIPVSGATISHRYRSGDFKSIACPQCVYGSVRALVS